MVLFYTLILWNIFCVSCLQLTSQDVDFISDVHNYFKFKASMVIVEDTADVNRQVRETLLKNEQSVFSIMEAKKIDKIIESVSKVEEHRSCFLFLDDIDGLIGQLDSLNRKVFKITTWFIVLRNESIESSSDIGLKFRFDSNVFLAFTRYNYVNIEEVYNIEERPYHIKAGHWRPNSGLSWSELAKWERRRDMGGVTLRSLYLEETGYLLLDPEIQTDPKNLASVRWVGLVADIYQSLADTFNFTYTLAQSRDRKWGAIDDSGEWNGLIRDLLDDVGDLSVCSLSITKARTGAVDFALPFTSDFTQFFVSKQTSSYSIDIYTKPFNRNTCHFLLYQIKQEIVVPLVAEDCDILCYRMKQFVYY